MEWEHTVCVCVCVCVSHAGSTQEMLTTVLAYIEDVLVGPVCVCVCVCVCLMRAALRRC